MEAEGDLTASSTAPPYESPDVNQAGGFLPSRPGPVRVPDSPPLSVQLPPSPPLSIQLPPKVSSFGGIRYPHKAPDVGRGRYEDASYDQIRELCRRRGYFREGPKEVPETRLASLAAEGRKRAVAEDKAADTPVAVPGYEAAHLWMWWRIRNNPF